MKAASNVSFSAFFSLQIGRYRFIAYLCTRNTKCILRGAVAFATAEIIPIEPETGNADAGNISPYSMYYKY